MRLLLQEGILLVIAMEYVYNLINVPDLSSKCLVVHTISLGHSESLPSLHYNYLTTLGGEGGFQ